MRKAVYQDDELTVHDAAMLMPEMPEEEYQELKESIRKNGQQDPIVILGDKIIDGRHRFRACRELGKKPLRKTMCGLGITDPYEYVIATNLHRRHLDAGQRSAVGVKLKAHYAELAKERQIRKPVDSVKENLPEQNKGQARDQAGKAVNVSGKSIDMAARVESASPELFELVHAGQVPVSSAEKIVKTVEPSKLKKVVKDVAKSENPKKAAVAAVRTAKSPAKADSEKDAERVPSKSADIKRLADELNKLSPQELKRVAELVKNLRFVSPKK
jgi:ParB-like chromosome segregation protein Spo0J